MWYQMFNVGRPGAQSVDVRPYSQVVRLKGPSLKARVFSFAKGIQWPDPTLE